MWQEIKDSLLMAFSLYSQIPVPQTGWSERSMRYCICFLPLVGAVIGTAQALLAAGLWKLSVGPVLRGALLTALPVLLSGGIHLDGFLDTCDAVRSYRGKKERLAILQDPHVGAFAVLGGILYFLLDLGIWAEAGSFAGRSAPASPMGAGTGPGGAVILSLAAAGGQPGTGPGPGMGGGFKEVAVLCLCFVLSRALSAYAAVTFPKAKEDGMLRQETDPVKKGAAAAMAAVSLLTGAAMVLVSPAGGAAAVLAALAAFVYYRRMSRKLFGGITGDLSGWFTQVCELASAGAAVLFVRILQAVL